MSNVIDIRAELNRRYQDRLEKIAAKMVLSEKSKLKAEIGALALEAWIEAGNGGRKDDE